MRAGVFILIVLTLAALSPAADIPMEYSTQQNLNDLINRYQRAQADQQEALRGAQMEEDINASLPKLEKQGKLKVLRMISRVGINKFEMIGKFIGDNTVLKQVIERYLQTEQTGRENGSMAISPANYNFRINAIVTRNSQTTYILDVKPKHKADGLFKGQVWLDAATAMPLKEIGQLVKTPSVWLKSIKFEREYELQDGVSVPTHIESKAEVRGFGPAELSANFSNLKLHSVDDAVFEDAASQESNSTDAP
jgi:hypothetical protein